MIQLPSTYYPNNSRVVVGTPQIFTDDVILLCDTSLAPVTINLLDIPDDAWMTTYKLYIVDNSSNASVNNITINAGLGQLINDLPSVTISTNGQCALVRIVSNNQYISTSSGGVVANVLEVLNEGVSITPNASSMDFVGSGITATTIGDNVTVTVNTPTPTTIAVTDTNTIDLTLTGGPAYSLSANIVDTGWVDLEGFEYQSTIGKPKCRKMGNQIHFRGIIAIPLSNDGGSTLIPLVNLSSYVFEYYNQVFTSTNGINKGVTVDPNGTIAFNLNSSVIPTSVLPALANFDGTYTNQLIATRQIGTRNGYGTSLSAFFQLIITSDKKLKIQTIIDFEEPTPTAPNYLPGSMPLRFITSYVRNPNPIPNYIGSSAFIHNAQPPAPSTLTADVFTPSENWPLDVDAAQPDQIGGFTFRLDGLIAYI